MKSTRAQTDSGRETQEIAPPESAHLMDRLTFETALLYLRMRVAAREYLGQGELSAARRSVVKTLGDHGPQTVPQMARARAVSRQHIQHLVDELRAEGLVRSLPNPAHKRSNLIDLGQEGRRFLASMSRREEVLWGFLEAGIPEEHSHTALEVIHALRMKFESEAWKQVAEAACD